MTAKIGIYETHGKALEAVHILKEGGFPVTQISLIGEAQIINDHMYLKSLEPIKNLPVAIGAIAGIVTGLLSGLGVFVIPGFGFLYGAGAIVGAIGGFDLGILGGGLATILAYLGIEKEEVLKYEESVKAGKFLVIAEGSEKEIKHAENLLLRKNDRLQLK